LYYAKSLIAVWLEIANPAHPIDGSKLKRVVVISAGEISKAASFRSK
jgi:hypothetical protein